MAYGKVVIMRQHLQARPPRCAGHRDRSFRSITALDVGALQVDLSLPLRAYLAIILLGVFEKTASVSAKNYFDVCHLRKASAWVLQCS